jgi:hypothetical protein
LRGLGAGVDRADTLGMIADPTECCRPPELSRCAGLRCTLLLIIVVAGVRGLALFRVGLWRDEAATYLYATAATPGAFIDLIRHVEANPPGFFYLMYVWVHAFGSAPAVIKLPAFAFSLVSIWLTYELGQRLHSPRVGVCAAVLVAIAPMATLVSIEGRAYTLAACLCTLTVLLYQRACGGANTPSIVIARVGRGCRSVRPLHCYPIPHRNRNRHGSTPEACPPNTTASVGHSRR